MRIDAVSLRNFRNYREADFQFDPGVNVITGENAQGKTNLLESLYLLTGAHSWRTRFDRELIAFGAEEAVLHAAVFAEERQQTIELCLRRGARRRVTKNGVHYSPAELAGTVGAVLFSPEDLDLVRAGAAVRRRFMDASLGQLRPRYLELTGRYNRLYDQKSAVLRAWREKPALLDMLFELSDQMCALSARIIRYRAAFLQRIGEKAGDIHGEFSGDRETLTLRYKTVSTVPDPFAPAAEIREFVRAHQKAHERAELESGSCLTGVHKDDLELCLGGVPARQFASQGQARTAALSLKMAERLLFLEETGQPPILLLDDVLSELDGARQKFVLQRIPGGQTFITCCAGAEIAQRTGGRVITIRDGRAV